MGRGREGRRERRREGRREGEAERQVSRQADRQAGRQYHFMMTRHSSVCAYGTILIQSTTGPQFTTFWKCMKCSLLWICIK